MMTQSQVDRMAELGEKMDRAAKLAGRTYTDTADLTPSERAEYRRLYQAGQDWNEEQARQHRNRQGGYNLPQIDEFV